MLFTFYSTEIHASLCSDLIESNFSVRFLVVDRVYRFGSLGLSPRFHWTFIGFPGTTRAPECRAQWASRKLSKHSFDLARRTELLSKRVSLFEFRLEVVAARRIRNGEPTFKHYAGIYSFAFIFDSSRCVVPL